MRRCARRSSRINGVHGFMGITVMFLLLALPGTALATSKPMPTPTPTHTPTPTPTISHTPTPTPTPTHTTSPTPPPPPYHTNLSLSFNISAHSISITIAGTGFLPGAQVSVDLNADQFGVHQHLGAGTADSHGNFTTTVSLPITFPKGSYQLQAAGIGSDANARLLSADLNFTGHGIAGVSSSHTQWLIDGAIGAVVAAMILFVAARRRRHKAEQAS